MKTKNYNGETIVLLCDWTIWALLFVGLLLILGLVLTCLVYHIEPNVFFQNGNFWFPLIVLITCVGLIYLIVTSKIEFNDDGISVKGAAVIPWSEIDEITLVKCQDTKDYYSFRYYSYDGKIRYLRIPDHMTNQQEAFDFAKKKRPDLFAK